MDVKTAVEKAYQYFQDLYEGKDLGVILLEEAELVNEEGKDYWLT